MTAVLVTVPQYRTWSGAATATISDSVIQQCLDEAESGLFADVPTTLEEISPPPWSGMSAPCGPSGISAISLATGEILRRSSRLLARRNSPEGVSGYGDIAISISSRDPDSARTIQSIRSILCTPEGVA